MLKVINSRYTQNLKDLACCGKKTIDVSETVKAEFEGYDGYGVCTIENEYDWIDNALELYGDKFDDLSYDLMDSVTYKMSKQENLSNDDTVTVTPVIGSEAEDYAFNLTGEPVTFTVEGLQEVEEFDPFDNITVSFEGISPNGTAVITEKKTIQFLISLINNRVFPTATQ